MSGTNNFLPWNSGAANQDDDAAYTADAQRTGGFATNATWPSTLANKTLYQVAGFVSSLAAALAAKGYNVVDTSLSALASVLANIVTNADGPPVVPAANYLTSIFPTITLSAASNQTAFVDATSANGVVNLPSSPAQGQIVTVKRTDSSGNTVSIHPGSNTIDGASSLSVATLESYMLQYEILTSNWYIIASH